MAFCNNCGKEVNDNQAVCLNCGASINSSDTYVVDNGGFGWGLLGFCIPVVGLVLFLVWNETKPRTAKAAGIGALVSVILGVFFYVILLAAAAGAA
ncbi:zinc ribbon domain-containing protein [Mycoplasmatota bacterium]|nr:zinc ribbon domain-containing protein [Mycoplasmatota bacterium]